MTDDRAGRAPGHPTGRRTEPVIEIELTGEGVPPGRESGVEPSRPPASTAGRARLLVAAAAVTVVAVAVVAVALGRGDDRPDSSATAPTSGAVLTTPSTLPPVDATDLGGGSPAATSSQDRTLFDPTAADLPTYPAVNGLSAEDLERFDLDAAVARLDDGVPLRSRTEYVVGASGYTVLAIITYEPATERFAAILTYDVGTTRLVVDAPGDAVYVADDDGGWERSSLDEVRAGRDGLDGLLRRLVLGPVRADTVGEAFAVEAGPAVTLDLGRTASREFTVALPARVVPEWSRYALGATGDAPPPGDDDAIVYSVYVDEHGEVRRVQGASTYGATTQTIVHSIERLPDATIELPDPATVRETADVPG